MNPDASSAVTHLYQTRSYPEMSHPRSDPAVIFVAARLAGLEPVLPSEARILEIGCASGHHLIPLAQRWPNSRFLGIDLSSKAIDDANSRAKEAGLENIDFISADLLQFDPGDETFDYIIAHGFFSWVPDEVKMRLLKFCRDHLSERGVASISYNLLSGWSARQPVVAAARSIQQTTGCDEISALEILKAASDSDSAQGANLRWIIEDMIAKGPHILLFDDFAPINDPWPLDRFLQTTAATGLRWLGESDPAENFPATLGDDSRAALSPLAHNPLTLQVAADLASGRTFRSSIFSKMDAPVAEKVSSNLVFQFAYRLGKPVSADQDSHLNRLQEILRRSAPNCIPVASFRHELPELSDPQLARLLFTALSRGNVQARSEPVGFDSALSSHPRLDSFRLRCAKEKLPIVDIWHIPCGFPGNHFSVLEAMDGTRSLEQLREISSRNCRELAFDPWMHHLAERGFFQ